MGSEMCIRDSYVVDGRTSRGDIEEMIGLRLPRGPYETVAGFLLEQFGSVPLVGEQLEWQGWKFEILGRENLRIAEISVERPLSQNFILTAKARNHDGVSNRGRRLVGSSQRSICGA